MKDGLKCFGEGDWLGVSKGALVVMKGKMNHGIYILEGMIIRGTVIVSQSLDRYDDKRKLCIISWVM